MASDAPRLAEVEAELEQLKLALSRRDMLAQLEAAAGSGEGYERFRAHLEEKLANPHGEPTGGADTYTERSTPASFAAAAIATVAAPLILSMDSRVPNGVPRTDTTP